MDLDRDLLNELALLLLLLLLYDEYELDRELPLQGRKKMTIRLVRTMSLIKIN